MSTIDKLLASESTVCSAARERWAVEASVVRLIVRVHHRPGYDAQKADDDFTAGMDGVWFILSVKVDGESQIVGRRRTLAELLELIESRDRPFVQTGPTGHRPEPSAQVLGHPGGLILSDIDI